MPMKFKAGERARQVVKAIEGPIVSVAIVDNEVHYEVAYTDEHGEPATRFFSEEQIEAAPDAEAAA